MLLSLRAAQILLSPEGGFYSSEDADSLPTFESKKSVEGAFYVLDHEECLKVLGDRMRLFESTLNVQKHGNISSLSDPFGELKNKNIPFLKKMDDLTPEIRESFDALKKHREEMRPRPSLDTKIITEWNAQMIHALVRCYQVFGDEELFFIAKKAMHYIIENAVELDSGVIWRTQHHTDYGVLTDFAFLIQSLLDLYSCDMDTQWLEIAKKLQDAQDRFFLDPEDMSYFSSGQGMPLLHGEGAEMRSSIPNLPRSKKTYDGVQPSGVAITIENLRRLGRGKDAWRVLSSSVHAISHFPSTSPQVLSSWISLVRSPHALIVGKDIEMTDSIRKAMLCQPLWEWEMEWKMDECADQPTVQLCVDDRCQRPVHSVEDLKDIMEFMSV
jgi:uncharacterized protein YyaL (SSP411 family)